MKTILRTFIGLFSFSIVTIVQAQEVISTGNDRQALNLTIYQNNLGLVHDERLITLPIDNVVITFEDVSAYLQPDSVFIKQKTNRQELLVTAQNFETSLLTPNNLLEYFIDKEIHLVKTNPVSGEEKTIPVTVLSTQQGVVLKTPGGIETKISGRIIFPDIPKELHSTPRLSVNADSSDSGKKSLSLNYLTKGLSWQTNYIAEISDGDKFVDLTAWVSLLNNTGITFDNAKIQLIAGEVNQAEPRTEHREMMLARATSVQSPSQSPFADYHRYQLATTIDIKNQQQKQIALFHYKGIPVTQHYQVEGSDYYYLQPSRTAEQRLSVIRYITFNNGQDENHPRNAPLPKGVVRFYKQDDQGINQFIGADQIAHTPKGQQVELKLGQAFDLSATRKFVDFEHTGKNERPGHRNYRTSFEIELANGSEKDVEILIKEPIPGDWKILKSSHPYRKSTAQHATWNVEVPANGKTVLSYTVDVEL